MTAMSDAERARLYRQRKKAKGESVGKATRLGPFVTEVVDGLSDITGESKAEIVRVLILTAIYGSYTDTEHGMTLMDALTAIKGTANPDKHPEQEKLLVMLRNIIKDTYNTDKQFFEEELKDT